VGISKAQKSFFGMGQSKEAHHHQKEKRKN
jgi:hypothetical protein